MNQILFIIAIVFLGIKSSVAQKTIQKEFSSEGIHALYIADDAIFKILIKSTKEASIKVVCHISGEHSESVIIEEKFLERKLSLKTGFAPFFVLEDDKLAAHKVMAVEMELIIPQTISVEIKSKLASVESRGPIGNLSVSLENGNCTLKDFMGNAHLKTVVGSITVHSQKNVSGKAISKNGTVKNNLSSKGKFFIEAESINGNIMLLQTK